MRTYVYIYVSLCSASFVRMYREQSYVQRFASGDSSEEEGKEAEKVED